MFLQSDLTRWTATRTLLVDLNRIALDMDLFAPIPHKKITPSSAALWSQKGRDDKKGLESRKSGKFNELTNIYLVSSRWIQEHNEHSNHISHFQSEYSKMASV
jgi:hypothetical protein